MVFKSLVARRPHYVLDSAILSVVTLAVLFYCYEFEVFPGDSKPHAIEFDELLLVSAIFCGGLVICAFRWVVEERRKLGYFDTGRGIYGRTFRDALGVGDALFNRPDTAAIAQLHKRQWVITSSKLVAQSFGFKSIALAPGLFLHYEPSLGIARDPTGTRVILGNAFGRPGVQGDAHYLTGRFVQIDYPWLSLDAMGLLGVYYFEQPGEVICSSSAALIADLTRQPIDDVPLNWNRGMNWDPLPIGRMPGLKKLYCDQVFNLRDRTVARRSRGLQRGLSEEQAGDALAQYFVDLMPEIARRYSRLYLALTGGFDSRVLMSALVAGEVQFEAVTWTFDDHSRRDAAVAKRICGRYGIAHHEIEAAGTDTFARAVYKRHTAGCVDDADAHHLVPGDCYRMFKEGDAILLGDGFEIGQRYYEQKFGHAFDAGVLTAEAIAKELGEKRSIRVCAALNAWLAYRESNPIVNMDLIDTFYLDQRLGGWQAAICQGQDCVAPDFIAPANSWTCIELLMAASPERRASRAIQRHAMEILAPGISRIPSA